ncbi:type I secretion C-terminal target domain-containing protein [Kiloniella spongiae]|uniref:type I secretion C-terminal target domain-containing protein n=1 Tax=Kiloniella spongiae TaxID=1489064 RepID=UPI00069C8D38|nr:type I secretion C-terminal target domain-containing protein [Kiloniella spongiae]
MTIRLEKKSVAAQETNTLSQELDASLNHLIKPDTLTSDMMPSEASVSADDTLVEFASALGNPDYFAEIIAALSEEEKEELAKILDQAPIETAAGDAVALVGGGGSQYSDDLGNAIDLLNRQGVIDPTELEFGLIANQPNTTDQGNTGNLDTPAIPFLNLSLNLLPYSIRDQGTYGNKPITLRGGDGNDILVDSGIIIGDGANNVYEIAFTHNLSPTEIILLQGFPIGTVLNQGTMISGSNGTAWEVTTPFSSIIFSADNSWTTGYYNIQATSGGLSSSVTITHQTSTSFGDDQITGGSTNDTIFGDDLFPINVVTGNDIINGAGGDDIIYGDTSYFNSSVAGNDVISGGTGDDLIFGDAGTIYSSILGNDRISGGNGNDRIYGDGSVVSDTNGGNDILDGGDGDDTIYGDGQTLLSFSSNLALSGGDDVINGGAGNDLIYGDSQTQSAYIQGFGFNFAKGGNDIIDGGDGDDIIYGDSRFYSMSSGYGVGGDDIITGGRGNDTMYGVDGNDRFVFRQVDIATNGPSETDTIKDFRLDDVIDLGDLLNTAQTVSNLDQYLDFRQGTNGVNIDIDSNQDGTTDHTIFLENMSLSYLSSNTGTSDTDILTNMLNQNALDTLA